MKKLDKTNVMRILDGQKIEYKSFLYECEEAPSGIELAEILGKDPKRVFKTLVTVSGTKKHYIFVIPADAQLNLKRAAKVVGEKSIEMIKSKELLPLTGYIHGGCSPIGMKKFFPTTVHYTAVDYETITFSAGRIGAQVEMSLEELKKVIEFTLADVADV